MAGPRQDRPPTSRRRTPHVSTPGGSIPDRLQHPTAGRQLAPPRGAPPTSRDYVRPSAVRADPARTPVASGASRAESPIGLSAGRCRTATRRVWTSARTTTNASRVKGSIIRTGSPCATACRCSGFSSIMARLHHDPTGGAGERTGVEPKVGAGQLKSVGRGDLDLVAKPLGFPGAVEEPGGKPGRAGQLGRRAETPPNAKADDETDQGRHEVEEGALAGADVITHEGCDVHPHEADERTEVEQLGAELITHGERTDQRQPPHKEDVVPRNLRSGIDCTEEAAGNGIVPAHAVEQPARGEMRTGPGSDRGDQERQVDREEQGRPTGLARNENERGIDVGKILMSGPD